MPVTKYKSIAEQPAQRWHEPGDPANLERVEQLMALAAWRVWRRANRGTPSRHPRATERRLA